ncbi:MAG: multifunctional oxoglutarate decarboxylase/oxoglutarate dehydrogenase thiamine pyrophosphate-binding subunit/dihydrolipoyllysine-residue succinyltransferase subunit [Chlorobiota bacterium]|nr:multifunctional oxoglutarate decarboxylase/oxoglutarate dehydrogenase thiamine pyrophosphate-binding subunit/dihydrolipoyllysine-residue succinyltransferase subunit [Chlorobiota bacterium]
MTMEPTQPANVPDINSAYVREMYAQYVLDPESVPPEWRRYFEQGGAIEPSSAGNGYPPPPQTAAPASSPAAPAWIRPEDELQPLEGVFERIALNMSASLQVPTATTFRIIPAKLLEENRWLVNRYRERSGKHKLSFTHLLGWAIVRALERFPQLNDACALIGGKYYRVRRRSINLGIAVDILRKDGTRSLVVPSIKAAEQLDFPTFVAQYEELVAKARAGRLSVEELTGATVTLTNPGMLGTTLSVARLLEGQGLIVAAGALNYPGEFRAVPPELLAQLGVGKVLALTSTYDHRIIQGAESGEFLAYIERLLLGEEEFYARIFEQLRIPIPPFVWAVDRTSDAGQKQERLTQLIRSYRVRGHLLAQINPLQERWHYHPDLDPAQYGLTIWDLDRRFYVGELLEERHATLRQVLELLWESYCGPIGVEYMHIQDPERRAWLRERLERERGWRELSPQQRRRIYEKLLAAEQFEQFLHRKFVGHKRFSLEGGEALLPLLDMLLQAAAERGVEYVVIGMAHRGRLNVLANLIGKSLRRIFDEFEGELDPLSTLGSGDVKYHLGARGVFRTSDGRELQVLLTSNPSHLEAVDPVVEGIARALQDQLGEGGAQRVLPILIHGDAAFAGQGIVAETLNLAKLKGYTTGGTVHIVVNNQIGFTTEPADARSTVYPTDVAKMVQAPIFHVNGDEPDAVCAVGVLALDYRMRFAEDAVIDLFCYRKYGHNEADEPTYTQPLLYRRIRELVPVRQRYRERLLCDGVLSEQVERELLQNYVQQLNQAFAERRAPQVKAAELSPSLENLLQPVQTGVPLSELQLVAQALGRVPEGFHLHPKLHGLFRQRAEILQHGTVDWATAELLAFGTLLLEGFPVRLSGQDSRRGTFSQRHAVVVDTETGESYIPLNHILAAQRARLSIYDSPLSELAVLGFEYGYSTQTLHGLTLWEAQFGDFANGAQVIIDQFIVSGESKWGQLSNLVLLLPHGYEGQGPEHSSARLERFLQLCAEGNIYVCNPTTPAQYFHLLRRQVLAPFRKPLVVMTPKSLLRHPLVSSPVESFTEGSFQEVLDDPYLPSAPEEVEAVVLCTGKFFYELAEYRRERGLSNVALLRIEQLYPLHAEKLEQLLRKYQRAERYVWAQEEPQNMGAWSFLAPQLQALLPTGKPLLYVGRPPAASPATGSSLRHEQEQRQLIEQAFHRAVAETRVSIS